MNQLFSCSKVSIYKIIILLLLLVAPALNAEAKWWIFGKSDAGVSTRYIYINDLSYDELGEKITLYRESLPQGKIVIRGKGSAGKNRIGAVQISLDGKLNWQKAKVTNNGSFLYSFTPELGKSYELFVKVLDTTGKSNDVDASRKELLVSDENVQDQVYAALDKLIKAYQDEDSFAFMRQVSDDFVSGTAILDSAIRQDFTAFDNIILNYSLNNVARANGGNLFVAISFSRMVTSSRSGETFNDQAATEFTFTLENGIPKIYSMKNPLIFGLSDAGEVATGIINSGNNSQVLAVNNSGTVSTKTLAEIVSGTSATSTISTETITLSDSGGFPADEGFLLATGTITAPGSSDIYLESNIVWSDIGTQHQFLGTTAIESLTSVPSTGYVSFWPLNVTVGDTFALRLNSGRYAIIQFSNATDDGSGNFTATIKYRYQADGSTTF